MHRAETMRQSRDRAKPGRPGLARASVGRCTRLGGGYRVHHMRHERQGQGEHAALPHLADESDAASVELDEAAGAREPEPGPMLLPRQARIELPELLK